MIAASEGSKLNRLYERYGLTTEAVDCADSVDLAATDSGANKEMPLF
jgi:hypothetical protein